MIDSGMVSVIIPVWNVEQFLDACLESVALQTYNNIEVIMVDDGSTDRSTEICRSWEKKDGRFILIRKDNEGPSIARNVGFDNAKGDYIAFVDGDDIIHVEYIETLVGIVKRKKVYSISGVDYIRFGDFDIITTAHKWDMMEFHHYLPEDALRKLLYQNDFICSAPWGKLFSREVIEGIRFKEGIIYEDLEWMVRVLEKMPKSKRIGLCNAPLYYYRKRNGSLMETFSGHRLDVLDITRDIEDKAIASADLRLVKAARDRRLSANFDIYMQLWKYIRQSKSEKDDTDSCGYNNQLVSCWTQIKRLRMGSLINPNVRRKNKLGILLSFLGPTVCGWVGSRIISILKK